MYNFDKNAIKSLFSYDFATKTATKWLKNVFFCLDNRGCQIWQCPDNEVILLNSKPMWLRIFSRLRLFSTTLELAES